MPPRTLLPTGRIPPARPCATCRGALSRSVRAMARAPERDLPAGTPDERELLLGWLEWLREAVLGKIDGLNETEARWTPEGRLISLLGIVNHLTRVEWR